MKGRTRALARQLVVWALTILIGLAGGRVLAAAWMFTQFGWTATWLEISSWGTIDTSDPNSSTTI